MPPDGSSFTTVNLPSSYSLPRCMEYFTLTAGPNTDLWRKPPDGDVSTAPIAFTSLRHPFSVAEVTVCADWEMEWDQGGLVIFAGSAPNSPSASRVSADHRQHSSTNRPSHHHHHRPYLPTTHPCKWVKAGMELCSGTVNASSVSATSEGADWCLSPLNLPPTTVPSLRIKLERIGHSLWIWYQIPSSIAAATLHDTTPGVVGSTWKKLREVTWFFYGVEDKFVHVGVYASRPMSISRQETMWETTNHGPSMVNSLATTGDVDGLVVEFEDLEIF